MIEREREIDRTSILVVFAGPEGTPPLRLGTEDRIIRECLDRSGLRENYALEIQHAATPYDVRRALLGGDYRIVHFSGHGSGGELVLENEYGEPQVVPQEALADLLSTYCPPIECVILNACYTEIQGELISQRVPYTIGISGDITDAAAREFTRGFYDAIGAGRDYRFAFQEGTRAVNLAGLGAGFKAVLFTETRDEEQADIRIISQQQALFDQEEEEEAGLLDYILDGMDSMERVSEIVGRITHATEELGHSMEEGGAELQRLRGAQDRASMRECRRLINRSADTMQAFARQLSEETPQYREAYSTAIDYYGKAITLLTTEFHTDNTDQVREALATVRTLEDSINDGRRAQADLRSSIAGLPRMTGKLNRAKRSCLAALDSFDREMEAGLQLTLRVEALMEGVLEEQTASGN
jgi:hypothetical protein